MRGGYFELPELDLGNGLLYRPGGMRPAVSIPEVDPVEQAKADYVFGRIEIDEFERRLDALILGANGGVA